MATVKRLGHPAVRRIMLFFIRTVMKIFLRLEISNVHHVPPNGPLVLIINHIAFLDPMVCSALPRLITPIAKKEAFARPLFRLIMNVYGTISIARGEADIQAMKAALEVLKDGGVILLAPEGTRSPTYQLQPAKEGAMMLAARSGAPIAPVGITGTHQLLTHWRKLRRAPVHLSVGEPFYLRSTSMQGRVSRNELAAMTGEAMYRLARQLPPEFRGVYHNLDEATERYIAPLEKALSFSNET